MHFVVQKGMIMNMKKVFTLILSLMLISNCIIGTPVLADNRLKDTSNIIGFLKTLNIGDESWFENLDYTVSRGEMIELVVDFMDCEAQADAYLGPIQFYDIDETDEFYKDICFAVANGFCHGAGDGMIHAYDNATVYQTIITFINALGLRNLAQMTGINEGYITIAQNTGILEDLTYALNQELTKRTAVLIMYNVLMSNVYERDYTHIADGANYSAGYSLKTDTNYLYERFKIYEAEGIVTAAPDAYIEGGVTKKGYVCIDSTIYSDPSFYAKDMLGKKVSVYLMEDSDGVEEIQYLCASEDNNVVTVFSNQISDYNEAERSYQYYPEGSKKAKTLNLTSFTEFIYNGAPVSDLLENIVNPEDGKFVFIDNNDDNKYDYVMIESFTTMLAESINRESMTVFDSVSNYTLNYELYGDRVYVFDADGNASDIENIPQESVLTFVEGEDVLKIYVSDNVIYDEIRAKRTDGEVTYLTLNDGAEYVAGKYFDKNCTYGQDVGQNGDFYIDVFGRITYMKNSFYNNLGYVINVFPTEEDKNPANLKILNIYGKTEVLKFSQKVRIDGVRCNSHEDITAQLSGIVRNDDGSIADVGIKNNIIVYELNTENEIISIETAYDFNNTTGALEKELADGQTFSKDDGVHMSYQLKDITYNGLRSFDGKGLMSASVKVFVVPVTASGEIAESSTEVFDVQGTGYFDKWSKYTANQYKISKDSNSADVVVVFENVENGSLPDITNVMCVNKVSEVFTEDEEIVRQFTGYVLGNEVTYVARNSNLGEGIERGDMIKFELDSKQRIQAVEKAYDASAGKMLSGTNSFANSFRVLMRPVYKIHGNVVIIAEKDELAHIVNENDYEGFFFDASIPVYKLDKTVRRADISEIVTYEQNPEEYSKLFLYMTSGNVKMAVIYD